MSYFQVSPVSRVVVVEQNREHHGVHETLPFPWGGHSIGQTDVFMSHSLTNPAVARPPSTADTEGQHTQLSLS